MEMCSLFVLFSCRTPLSAAEAKYSALFRSGLRFLGEHNPERPIFRAFLLLLVFREVPLS